MPAALSPSLANMRLATAVSLPPEILLRIFAHLDDVRHLATTSLVNKAWRAAATDNRLWEKHYWRVYRPILTDDDDNEPVLQHARKARRQTAMLAWLSKSTTSPPASELFEAYSRRVGLARKDVLVAENETVRSALNITEEEYENMLSTRRRILEDAEKVPAALETPLDGFRFEPPLFLMDMVPAPGSSDVAEPNFHSLFARRMNADDELLRQLREYVDLKANTLHELLTLIAKHRYPACHLFAALCATQGLKSDNVQGFLSTTAVDDDASWPRAIEVHDLAAEGKGLPHKTHCLALHHAASKALGHLQRRSAIHVIQSLQTRKSSFELGASNSLKEHISRCCVGVEEALTAVAQFRGADPLEVAEYMDLLALFVCTDLQAEDRQTATEEGAENRQSGSTRHRLVRIVESLFKLRFCHATGDTLFDIDNAFLNAVLFCPGQRAAFPVVFASIIGAVARRLGVSATIANTSTPALIVAVESGPKPASQGPFFVEITSDDECFVREADWASRAVAESSVPSPLDPASPLVVLEQIASSLLRCTEQARTAVTRSGARERYLNEDQVLAKAAAEHQLASLRHYLESRQPSPPSPLLPPALPSSLVSLPPTTAHTPCKKSIHLDLDAEYCAKWILRLVAPQKAGGLDEVNDSLGVIIASTTSGFYSCDYGLLIQF